MIAKAGVVEWDIDEDGLEVAPVGLRDGVGDAELLGQCGAGVGEQGKGQLVLLEGETILAGGLRGDGDEQGSALAKLRLQALPGFQLGDTVRTPATAEEIDDQRTEGEKVVGADRLAGSRVLEAKGRSLRTDGEQAIFDARVEEIGDSLFGDGEAFRLDQGPGVLGNAIELVLQ